MRHGTFLVTTCLLPLAAMLAASCAGKGGPGDACHSTGDCTQPSDPEDPATIVCALGRCHFECTSSSFCGVGSVCAIVQGSDFCTFADEASCTAGASCPSALTCGSDFECRTPCAGSSDCLPNNAQACKGGVCVDIVVAADAGEGSGG